MRGMIEVCWWDDESGKDYLRKSMRRSEEV
jgi:hypothetical protein